LPICRVNGFHRVVEENVVFGDRLIDFRIYREEEERDVQFVLDANGVDATENVWVFLLC
jgi:hypothetical protein